MIHKSKGPAAADMTRKLIELSLEGDAGANQPLSTILVQSGKRGGISPESREAHNPPVRVCSADTFCGA
jgi:hypothetical protein